MDGKGRWIDNVLIERLRAYFETYNSRRLHQSLNYLTPDEVYFGAPVDWRPDYDVEPACGE